MSKISYHEASKIKWEGVFTEGITFPGNEKIYMACLQRIAAATEAMAGNYRLLQTDLEMYKSWYKAANEMAAKRQRSITAHKANYTRLKKKLQLLIAATKS